MASGAPTEREQRADAIRRAAIPVFASQGFRRTSMADLARAAGVSRQTLYQYFNNRPDVFRATLQVVVEDATDAALAALATDRSAADRLDCYLQRFKGDAYEQLAATPFGAELTEARLEFAADVAEAAFERARRGLREFVNTHTTVSRQQRETAIDLLVLAPAGLSSDQPTSATYRRRLTALATAASALLQDG